MVSMLVEIGVATDRGDFGDMISSTRVVSRFALERRPPQ
jgi:hypothetical protein